MNNIKVFCQTSNDVELGFKSFTFPGGEIGVKFDQEPIRPFGNKHELTIVLRAKDASDLIELAMVKDAIQRQFHPTIVNLILPYIPYARQDRVCDAGESFSLKVFAGYLNYLNFNKVTVYDPHSDVAPALIDRVEVITQTRTIENFSVLWSKLRFADEKPLIVSPDSGANKKVTKTAVAACHANFIQCDKVRELSTGKIIKTVVHAEKEQLLGREVIILDDICDAGATFIELAKVLKEKGAASVGLYVTHGIFSRGLDHLFNNGIDQVFTTNSLIDAKAANEYKKYGTKVQLHYLI